MSRRWTKVSKSGLRKIEKIASTGYKITRKARLAVRRSGGVL